MTDVHSLSGAFALDALDERERVSFTRHMESCEACSLEVAELCETAARLADDVWSVPPPRMREAVLARVATTRQQPPLRRSTASRGPRTHRQSWRHRATMALVAASMVGLAALSGVVIVQKQQADSERARIQAVLSAPDAALRTGQLANGGYLNVVVSPSQNAAVVTLAQAQKFSTSQAYQVWKVTRGQASSAGVMPPGSGDALLYVPDMSGTEAIAVTVERASGSPQPTEDPRAVVPLTT
jgi:Anti-sigma-K factor rskA/Putative zinc-finger